MRGIPDPGGVSGTFAALERTSPIVESAAGDVPTTTSMRVANGTDVQHKNVMELIRGNLADFHEFGMVAFETRPRPVGQHGGGDVQIAILNEEHATLLLTYMRNNEIVRDFKKRLVREFSALRRAAAPAPSGPELVALALVEANKMLGAKDERIAELTPKAEFFDELMDADGSYTLQATANMIRWGRNVMMRELRRAGILQGNNLPYRRYAHHFKVIPGTRVHPKSGDVIPTATTHVLPTGVEFIRKRLADNDATTPSIGAPS
ncbi:MAG: phage regulatory protein/antirepressor Ant [Mycobacterium sp.]|nr:phage regulatory protein/antirepressor Ant [Mycobacterium sp.]